MSGANKKQEAARKARLEREAAERAAHERAKRLKLLGGAGVAIVAVVALVLALGLFRDDAASNAGSKRVTVDGAKVEVKGGDETSAELNGLPQRGNLLGDPNAPVTIVEVADLKCPACQYYSINTQPEVIKRLVRPGKANLEIQLVNFRDGAAGTTDGETARTVAYNLAARNAFFGFVSMLYFNQGDESETWATERKLKAIAEGTPGLEASQLSFSATPEGTKLVDKAEKLASALNPQGTPSVYVKPRGVNEYTNVPDFSNVDAIASAVDEAAKKAKDEKATR